MLVLFNVVFFILFAVEQSHHRKISIEKGGWTIIENMIVIQIFKISTDVNIKNK